MAEKYIVNKIEASLLARDLPAITRWNRLEGRPRTRQFDRALQAEVRDALWMLTRQWQFGEFHGDDAGSPVAARACIESAQLDRFQAGDGPIENFSLAEPIEAKVERRPVSWLAGAQYLSLDLRLLAGRRWLKMLAQEQAAPGGLSADYRADYLDRYPVDQPNPEKKESAAVCAHREAWQQAAAVAGRAMDGGKLLLHLQQPAGHAAEGIPADPADRPKLDALAVRFKNWFNQLIYQPAPNGNDAWQPTRLEYQFGCSAPNGQSDLVLRAEEYYQGHLDWYALELQPQRDHLGETPPVQKSPSLSAQSFLPASIVFEGMPNTRWWEFEDRRTNFGEVRPDTTDLGKLLLVEFGLVYANDWFVLPYTLPVGTLTTVKGISLTNVFGERIWIEPVKDRSEQDWERWSLFSLNPASDKSQHRLLLLPTVPKTQEGPPFEEIALVRDEMANMVWAIEKRIPLPSGVSKPGAESALEFRDYLQRLIDAAGGPAPAAIPPKAPIRYRVMNEAPENWIPFIPVHLPAADRQIRLQRAALPRFLKGGQPPAEKIRPRTNLVREGLDQRRPYFVNEEEVPRAGALVDQSFQRTRWYNGKVFTWIGVRKQTGRGEGSSGLAFDLINRQD